MMISLLICLNVYLNDTNLLKSLVCLFVWLMKSYRSKWIICRHILKVLFNIAKIKFHSLSFVSDLIFFLVVSFIFCFIAGISYGYSIQTYLIVNCEHFGLIQKCIECEWLRKRNNALKCDIKGLNKFFQKKKNYKEKTYET